MNAVEQKKEKLATEVEAAIEKDGVFHVDTCPTGAAFGWDMPLHYALEWFMRNPPSTWHITRVYRHECYEWAITRK